LPALTVCSQFARCGPDCGQQALSALHALAASGGGGAGPASKPAQNAPISAPQFD
jgi:hypothetical protein